MADSPVKIIVVDDSATLRLTLERFLGARYELRSAEDGAEGIRLYEEFRPDIVLLDINMPVVDGFGVIEHIRNAARDTDAFILMLTAAAEATLKPRALNLGANDFLLKPFDRTELMARVGVAERQVMLTRNLRATAGRLRREIAQVGQLQATLLPTSFPEFEGLRVESLYMPSGQASGDYYDVFPAGGVCRVVIADVSGHGARAAFIMAIVRTLFRLRGPRYQDIAATVDTINEQLREVIGAESDFVTLFAADIDLTGNSMEYVNAGHCPGLLHHADGRVESLGPDAPVLGFFDMAIKARSVKLTPGCQLFLFTDGFYEWATAGGEHLGAERFWEMAASNFTGRGPFLDRLMERLRGVADGTPRFRDDLTALWMSMEGAE
jgi:sigma-B regulation protein RsbU (phosphoserine phosphatase)